MTLQEKVTTVLDRLLAETEEESDEEILDPEKDKESDDAEAPTREKMDSDLQEDVDEALNRPGGIDTIGGTTDRAHVFPGVWLKPPPFWESWRTTLSSALQQLYGKLDAGFATRQRTGILDMNRVRYWKQSTRIFEKRLPDRRIDAGVHVIFSVDASGSMGTQASDPETMTLRFPDNVSEESRTPPILSSSDPVAAEEELDRPGTSRGGGVGAAGSNSIDSKNVGELTARARALFEPTGNRDIKMIIAMGLVYVLGQALEDVGSDCEVVLWDADYYDWLKTTDQRFAGRMFYTVGGGLTEPRTAVKDALRKFERSRTPGRIFVTLSDGAMDSHEYYREKVMAMNKLGVVTIFLALGTQYQLRYAFPGVDWTDPKLHLLGHQHTIVCEDVQDITTKLPTLILRLQQTFVENAARMDPGRNV